MAEAEAPATVPDSIPEDPAAKLDELIELAAGHYAQKHYDQAADIYSEATALQAEINGELDPRNADLLYAYGRCLYHLAVGKSDVLGGKVAGSEGKSKGKKRKRTTQEDRQQVDEKIVEKFVEKKEGTSEEQKKRDEKNPFLKIEGDDADWDGDSDDDEAEDAADGEAEEEEDDFANAFEILDLTRVLLQRRVDQLQSEESEDKGKGRADGSKQHGDKQDAQTTGESNQLRKTKELLADTHDLQSEISLENERFQDAVIDATSCLSLKKQLYPFESSLVAEAHYKLSLALEFASVTSVKEDKKEEAIEVAEGSSNVAETPKQENVDEEMRKEAARHMEMAISSTKLRVAKEKETLASVEQAEEKKKKEIEIKDVEDIVSDMEIRLEDLRNPAIDVAGATGPAGAPDGSNPLSGMIGAMLGESPAAQRARIEEATKTANDLTSMIRHKKKDDVNGSAKRKAETVEDPVDTTGKRAKTEERTDS